MLENLQWADASSLELLHFVARQIASQKIVLLGTYNEAERDSNAVLRSTEQSLLGLGSLSVRKLGPLEQAEVEEIVQQMFGVEKAATRHFSPMLYDWTRGNPFFVEETLKSLVDSGALTQKDGRWTGWEMQTLHLPATIRDVVKTRVDRLSPHARTLANLAAVIGTRADYDTLAKVSGLAQSEIITAVDELLAQRVLEETGSVDAIYYDFTHPLLQQVIYTELGQARARLLHATIAEALESLYGNASLNHADELALHFARAHSQSLARKAVRYLYAAGRGAIDKYANREAANYLAAALEHLDKDPTITDAPREEILTTLARTRQRLGEYDAAMELWTRARGEAAARGEEGALADIEHRMGLACYWSGKYADALAHYEAGLREAAASSDKSTAVRLRLAKGIALQDLGRLKEAQVEVEAALALAKEGGIRNDALLSRAHRALLLLYTWTGPLDLAREHGTQAIAHAEAARQRMLEWTAHWGMALLEGICGDAAAIPGTASAESDRLAEQMHSPLLPLWSAELFVQYSSSVGDWDAAIETAERTISLAKSLNQRVISPTPLRVVGPDLSVARIGGEGEGILRRGVEAGGRREGWLAGGCGRARARRSIDRSGAPRPRVLLSREGPPEGSSSHCRGGARDSRSHRIHRVGTSVAAASRGRGGALRSRFRSCGQPFGAHAARCGPLSSSARDLPTRMRATGCWRGFAIAIPRARSS